jgi:hypothetical protein
MNLRGRTPGQMAHARTSLNMCEQFFGTLKKLTSDKFPTKQMFREHPQRKMKNLLEVSDKLMNIHHTK